MVDEVACIQNIQYLVPENSTLNNSKQLSLDVYFPKETSSTTPPLLFFIHGGAWRTGTDQLRHTFDVKG
jgi:carboxylesterase type B